MEHVILTRNTFVAAALDEILGGCCFDKVCVVDIDSYRTLSELLQVMEDSKIELFQKIHFIKGVSVYSKILSSVATLDVDKSVSDIKKVILLDRAPEYAFVRKSIRNYIQLSMMTLKEKQIAYALVKYRNVPSIARAMNSNHKTIYSRIQRIAIKLNLQNMSQVRSFVFSELARR